VSSSQALEGVSVEVPPLEEVIAQDFAQSAEVSIASDAINK
jgi:hypothetical protein